MLESHWLRAEKYVRSHVLGLRLHFCSFSCKVNQRTSCLYQESVFCLWLFHCCVLLTPHPTWLPFSQNPLVIINIFISKKKKKKLVWNWFSAYSDQEIFLFMLFSPQSLRQKDIQLICFYLFCFHDDGGPRAPAIFSPLWVWRHLMSWQRANSPPRSAADRQTNRR